MKATIGFSLGLAVALIPFAGGGDPTSTNSNPVVAPADQVSGDSSNAVRLRKPIVAGWRAAALSI